MTRRSRAAPISLTVKKHLRARDRAIPVALRLSRRFWRCVSPAQTKSSPTASISYIFYNQANLSALGVPQIAIVGLPPAAHVPAMSDESIIVEPGTIFLGGPPW